MVNENLSSILAEDKDMWWVDKMYLNDAFWVARRSTDPRTQVGANLVLPVGGVVLSSCNGIPEPLLSAGYPRSVESKNYCTEHAERLVIYTALKNRLDTNGLTMYSTWAACSECARTIIQFGIRRIVTLRRLVEMTDERWADSTRNGLEMMRDSGISVVGWSGDLSARNEITFNGMTIGNKDLI